MNWTCTFCEAKISPSIDLCKCGKYFAESYAEQLKRKDLIHDYEYIHEKNTVYIKSAQPINFVLVDLTIDNLKSN